MNREQREDLVFGYVRLHVEQWKLRPSVPMVLVQLVHQFYDAVINWQLQTHQLHRILHTNATHKLYFERPIHVDQLTFYCVLQCVAYNLRPHIRFFVECPSIQTNSAISAVHIYYELHCKSLDIVWKNIAHFTQTSNDCGWPLDTLQADECEAVEKRSTSNSGLSLECYIEVVHVDITASRTEDGEVAHVEVQAGMVEINDCEQYEWEIDADSLLLKYLKHFHQSPLRTVTSPLKRRFYSENFGSRGWNNWCIECVLHRQSNLMLYLRLLGLPPQIAAIKVAFILKMRTQPRAVLAPLHTPKAVGLSRNDTNETVKREYMQIFHADAPSWGCDDDSFSFDQEHDRLSTLAVELQIVEVYSSLDPLQTLPTSQWLDAGVLSLNHLFDDD